MELTYKTHAATPEVKKHTDILLNGSYIGYFVNETRTVYFEYFNEVFCGEFRSIKELKQAVIDTIKEF
jgi:hypothetical protein